MLSIRMQRTGRKGHAQYRVVVQDSRQTPTSGKFVAMLGSYDPHAKTHTVDIKKAEVFMNNGAQPSGRVARLLQNEGVKLPDWVKLASVKNRTIRNADKLRKNRPAEEEVATPEEAEVAETPVADAEEVSIDVAEEAKTEEAKAE